MTLVVETGDGLPNADAYDDADGVEAYAASRGLTWAPADVAAGEAAIRRAATWLDATYRSRLPGTRLNGRSQGLEWPRKNATDASGETIAMDEIPAEWLRANAEAAIRELASPGSLSPDVTVGRVKKSVSVAGAVSVTYADEGGVVASQRPILTLVDDILGSLLSQALTTGRTTVTFLRRA